MASGWFKLIDPRELEILETEPERTAARRHVEGQLSRTWGFFIAMLLIPGIITGFFSCDLTDLLRDFLTRTVGPLFRITFLPVLEMIIMIAMLLTARRMCRARAHRLLRTYLRSKGIPVCLHCGYDLRGHSQERCPECGRWCCGV